MTDYSLGLRKGNWLFLGKRISGVSALLPAWVLLLGLGMAGSVVAQDYAAPAQDYPALAQDYSVECCPVCVPERALFVSFGGSLNSVNFGDQDIFAVGTSVVSDGGVTVASGSAGPPASTPNGTLVQMDTQVNFSPSVQLGFFEHTGNGNWLWGFKFTYDYLGTTSTFRRPVFPQEGTFTEGTDPPIPFTGNAVAFSTQTEIEHQMALRPFLGQSFERGFVYFGGGPTVSREQSNITQLVGFADINGNRSDISGAPQDFSDSSWVWGGSAEIGVTYFLDRSWFLDCSYVLGVTANHSFDFASTFSSTFTNSAGDELSQAGTLVGSSNWHAFTQGIGIRIGTAF